MMRKTSLVILGATVALTAQALGSAPNQFEQDLLDRVDQLPACTPETVGVVAACVDRPPAGLQPDDGDPIYGDAPTVVFRAASSSVEQRLRRQLARERTLHAAQVKALRTAKASGWTPALNRQVGRGLAAQAGWTGGQWQCLDQLVWRESRWIHTARNPTSGAYGIPQSLPAGKMATSGADWKTNPVTQTRWLIGTYLPKRYGTPCAALAFHGRNGWY